MTLSTLFHRPRLITLFLAAIAVTLLFAVPMPVAASSCSTSGPSGGAYSVTLCFTAPSNNAKLTGDKTVTVSVSVTGTNPGTQRVNFTLNGQYLITDYQSTYTFTLPTAKFVDGSYTLAAQATMRDNFVTTSASLILKFSNGITTPPVNTKSFTPVPGNTPAAGASFIVAAVGDGASGETNSSNVVSLIKGWNPNLFLYLGDVYEKGSPVEFLNWYNPTGFYGAFRAITNPTIGNHEYTNGSAPGYFDYWNNVPSYYSFNAGGWHFISLNANAAFGQFATSSPQYQWLQQDLGANAAACTMAYYHEPVFNIGPEGEATAMDPIWSLLYASGVDLVLNGHDHDYQRWKPLDGSGNPVTNGLTEIVVGTGGHGIQQFERTDSRVAKSFDSSSSFGALKLTLGMTSANFAFVNTAGTTLDSGTVPCHGAPAPTPTPSPTATPANATTFVDSADAFVDSSNPSSNFGTPTSLRLDASPTINSYLKFSVQNLGGTVTKATLNIFASSSLSAGYEVHAVTDNTWSETAITYNNAPALGTLLNSSGAVTGGTWVGVDVTALVKGNGTFSFGLRTTSSTALSLASRESGANAPNLVIQTNSSSPTNTATRTATSTPTRTRTNTPAAPTNTPTNTPIAGSTPTRTPTNTPTRTNTPTNTPSTSTTTVNPVADSYVDSSNVTANFGTATTLRVDGSPIINGYLKFTVPTLSGAIKSVSLQIFANSSLSTGVTANRVADNTWSETTITWSNAPAIGTSINTSAAVASGTWITIDVTPYITASGTYSLALTSANSTALSMASRESANPPKLVISTQ